MVRVRNLVLAIAAATALTSNAFALGLGEVKVQSSLNQPLVAEIELLDTKALGMAEIIPSLASAEDFNKVGVDRTFFLSDLKFEPVKRPDGRHVIRVTSSQPVREPYLNFLVEVLWPNGRLLREYTLLLDPPLYSAETVARVAPQLPVAAPVAPVARKVEPKPVVRQAVSQPTPAVAPAPVAPEAAATGESQGDVYRVTSRDTLWEIAQRSRHDGTVHQAMLAIQDLNPGAFVDGNINRMKSGQVLRLPSAEQVARRSHAEAVAQVAEQNAAWREGRSIAGKSPAIGARQLDATRRETAGEVPVQRDQQDSLRLVAGDAGSATEGSEKGADDASSVAALKDRLSLSEENLDSSRRENAELKGRLEDLQAQLEKLQRLMELKDDQLAQLQQQMAEAGTDAALAAAPAEAEAPAAEQAESKVEETAVAAPVVAAPEVVTPPASEPSTPAIAPQPAAEPAPAPASPKPAAPVARAPVAPEPVDEGLLGTLLANPLMVGVGGGALLLLLAGLLIQSRRKAIADDELADEEPVTEYDSAAQEHPLDSTFADLGEPESQESEADVSSAEGKPATDILVEADTFIAYGRFTQAAELLQNALNQEPHRRDLRLKLLEVRAEMGDLEGFAREESELREIGGSDAEISKLKSRYPAMAVGAVAASATAAADDFDSFDFDLPSADDSKAPEGETATADEFDFSLDDLESQLGSFDEPAAESAPAAEKAVSEESDLSFDFNLAAETSSSNEETLSLPSEDPFADFSLDADLEATAEAPAEEPEDDFSFDLGGDKPAADAGDLPSFDLDLDLNESVSSESTALPEDFDLSLDEDIEGDLGDGFAAQLGDMDAELEELSKRVDEPAAEIAAPVAAAVSAPAASGELDEDFDFLAGTDETTTKLDLARAYIEMGDSEGARDILDEILSEGNEAQQQEARDMLTALT